MQTDTFENSSTAINKTEGIKEQIIKKTNTSNRVVHYCESLDEGADQKKDPIGLLNQKTDRSYRFYLFTNTSSKY